MVFMDLQMLIIGRVIYAYACFSKSDNMYCVLGCFIGYFDITRCVS